MTDNRFFQKIFLFQDLTPEEIDKVLSLAEARTFPADAVIIHEGEAGNSMFIMAQGEVEIIKRLGIVLDEESPRERIMKNACVANERLQDTLRRSPAPSAWECVSWKAVVVSSKDFRRLLEIAGKDVRLWLFHGKDLPVEEPELVAGSLELIRREECPFHPGWFLSEFHRRSVSRETG